MHVDVQRPRCRRVQGEPLDARLLPRLAEGDRLTLALPGLCVAAGLEPAPELSVVKQEHPVAGGRHDDGAAGEVSFDDATIERIGMAVDEGEHLGQIRRLLGVRR
jgi:hypothetical protein